MPAGARSWSRIDEERLEAEQDPQTVDPALRQDLMRA